MNGVSVLIKVFPRESLILWAMWGPSRKVSVYEPGSGPLPHAILIMDLRCQNCEEYISVVQTTVYGIFVIKPQRTKQNTQQQERFWRNVSLLFTLTAHLHFNHPHFKGSLPQVASGKYIIQIQKLSNKYWLRGSLENWELSSVVLYQYDWCLFLKFKSC